MNAKLTPRPKAPAPKSEADAPKAGKGQFRLQEDPAGKAGGAAARPAAKGASSVKSYDQGAGNLSINPATALCYRPAPMRFGVYPAHREDGADTEGTVFDVAMGTGSHADTCLPGVSKEVGDLICGYLQGEQLDPAAALLARCLLVKNGNLREYQIDRQLRALAPRPRLMQFNTEAHPGWKLHKWSESWALEGREPGELDAVTKKFGKLSVTIMEDGFFASPDHLEKDGHWHGCWSYVVSGGPNHPDSHSGLTPPFATLDEALDYMEKRHRRGMLGSGKVLPEYQAWSDKGSEIAEAAVVAAHGAKNASRRTVEIYAHTVEWKYNDGFAPDELPESEEEHIKGLIRQGYTQGELVFYDQDDAMHRGWWNIAD